LKSYIYTWTIGSKGILRTKLTRKCPGMDINIQRKIQRRPFTPYLDICLFWPSNDCSSQTFSLSSVCHIFIRTFLALMSAMSSMMSSCRLNWLPVGEGVAPPPQPPLPEPPAESLRYTLGPLLGYAAIDSRLFRPNSGMGALDIVMTECRRPGVYGPGALVNVAKNAFSLAAAPAAPWSLSLRTCGKEGDAMTIWYTTRRPA